MAKSEIKVRSSPATFIRQEAEGYAAPLIMY